MAARKKEGAARAPFKLVSPDIRPNGPIAMEQVFNGFGCSGGYISPELGWSGAPEGTKSFALLVHDPDATRLKKDAGKADGSNLPSGCAHIDTDFGGPGWGGPCPPAGDKPHRYNFTLYALKVDGLDAGGASASLAGYMINANAIGKAKLTGKFGRKK